MENPLFTTLVLYYITFFGIYELYEPTNYLLAKLNYKGRTTSLPL